MIYVSTGGHNNWSFDQTTTHLLDVGINAFELYGGVYVSNVEEKLKEVSQDNDIVLHNYFPPAEQPFVFNLASLQNSIAEKSIKHAKYVIDLSSMVGSKYYSFHAGYLIDPAVNELGKRIKNRTLNDRNESKELFIERVNELSIYAANKNIKLMIENNVLSHKNYHEFKQNPLLMVDKSETEEIIEKTDSNVELLIDVAHLKVSANTLGFSAKDYLLNFIDTTLAYHLSDNQGQEDSNNLIKHDSWFWPYINTNLDYYSLEIYNVSAQTLKQQLELTEGYIG